MMKGEEIEVDDAVKRFIMDRGGNYRVTTTCSGALILPTSISPPKETDIIMEIGASTLYVSIYQARWIKRIDKRMLYYVHF